MSAKFSPCGKYRYRIDREVQPIGNVYAFFGINPSTAGAEIEDATSRKWRGFSRVLGARKYIAANPFAFCATNVKELANASDPVGPDNLAHITQIISEADFLVPCWGSRDKIPKQLHHHLVRLKRTLFESGKPVAIFGLTASGYPKHPLMLSYNTPLQKWTP